MNDIEIQRKTIQALIRTVLRLEKIGPPEIYKDKLIWADIVLLINALRETP